MSTPHTIAGLGLSCASCGWSGPVSDLAWRCERCRGVLDLAGFNPAMPVPADLTQRPQTLWRYRESLPVSEPAGLSMGEGMTPLLPAVGRPELAIKVDYLMPTGSFKDRGAVLLAALASHRGVEAFVADSSGNAGTAIAAYASRLGIACDVYVPASTSSGKLAQLRAYGASVHRVEGSREDTAAAAGQAAERPGVFYASHVYNPVFLHGTKTYVLELWEQLGGRLPGTLVLPVGNGTLVLGCHLGSRELLAQGLIDRLPTIIAVQADACAPLARAMSEGETQPAEISTGPTIAEGIAIARPARGGQILAAVAETGGTIATVTDDQVRFARADLARSGLYVEPTSAVCWAAILAGLVPAEGAPRHQPDVVVPLCGTGLKSGDYGEAARPASQMPSPRS